MMSIVGVKFFLRPFLLLDDTWIDCCTGGCGFIVLMWWLLAHCLVFVHR
jgi:hypothetical protein